MIAATVPMISGCSGRLITISNGKTPSPSGAITSARTGMLPASAAPRMAIVSSRHSIARNKSAQTTPCSRTNIGASSQLLTVAENRRTGIMNNGGAASELAPHVSLSIVSRPGE